MSSYKITQQFFATVRGKRREILRTVRCDDWPCCGPFVGESAPEPTPPTTPITPVPPILTSWVNSFDAVWLDENNNQWEA